MKLKGYSGMIYSLVGKPLLSRIRRELRKVSKAEGIALVCLSAYAD